jgi:hypothetical protein
MKILHFYVYSALLDSSHVRECSESWNSAGTLHCGVWPGAARIVLLTLVHVAISHNLPFFAM